MRKTERIFFVIFFGVLFFIVTIFFFFAFLKIILRSKKEYKIMSNFFIFGLKIRDKKRWRIPAMDTT